MKFYNRNLALILFALLMSLYGVASTGAEITGAEKKRDEEFQKSYVDLMDLLALKPVVNMGSDDILSQLPDEDADTVSDGLIVYSNHCAACHGQKLEGQANWKAADATGLWPAPPHDNSGHTWHHADDQLFEMVKYGPAVAMNDLDYKSMMPAFKEVLSDEDIVAVLVFIRSTWSTELKKWQGGANDAQTGREWWRENK